MARLPLAAARVVRLVAFLCAGLTPGMLAAAQTPMSAAEFEAFTTGRTLYFYSQGQAYGVEEYKEGRRVVWSFLDGQCKDGVWYPQGDQICFVYEDNPDPQCWTFFLESRGLRAVFEGQENSTELYQAGEADDPMICLGPEVGV